MIKPRRILHGTNPHRLLILGSAGTGCKAALDAERYLDMLKP